jgi:hypothetical protein
MPEQWRQLITGDVGAWIATIAGAAIRGLLGPGRWRWGQFTLACAVGIAFTIWVAPAVGDALGLGERAYGGLCLGFGMTAVPISRGLIRLARLWAARPEDFTNHK